MISKFLFPAFVVCAGILVMTVAYLPAAQPDDAFNYPRFGTLPCQENGRIMPIDTLARIRLMYLGHKDWVRDVAKNPKGEMIDGPAIPQVAWLLDVMTPKKKDAVRQRRSIRIDNDALLDRWDLDKHRTGLRYSIDEFIENRDFLKEADRLRKNGGADKEKLEEVKIEDLVHKVMTVGRILNLGDPKMIPPAGGANDKSKFTEYAWLSIAEALPEMERIDDEDLGPMNPAADPKATAHVVAILKAYGKGDVARFNREVDNYHAYLDSLSTSTFYWPSVEATMNRFAPFEMCRLMFVAVFLLACLSWVGWHEPLANAALALGGLLVIVYTVALVARIFISGYAPVTNLYSSAIFIGWGAVILCLILEASLLRNGFGSVLAAVSGYLTLTIAVNLVDGDTMGKLVAVLESNFWLSTHVTCVTLGYTATFVAGLLGITYVFAGMFTPKLRGENGVMLVKVTYGVICFAMFLSFVGTVLGGIWADQSWGRFWGWDPKENGALLIVVWNALILHARWSGLARSRGIALCAIFGNVVTAWSWFGVNMLNIGLHSYGFMSEARLWLLLWLGVNLAIIGLGLIPQRYWASFCPLLPEPPELRPGRAPRLEPV